MARKAEMFASGDRKWENNEQLRAAVEDVRAVHKRGIDGIKFELEVGHIDAGDEIREMTEEERTAREGRLANAHSHRYELLDDGSVVEIEIRGDSDEVTLIDRPNLVTSPKGLIAGGPGATAPADDTDE
jgi:hypothetical protein